MSSLDKKLNLGNNQITVIGLNQTMITKIKNQLTERLNNTKIVKFIEGHNDRITEFGAAACLCLTLIYAAFNARDINILEANTADHIRLYNTRINNQQEQILKLQSQIDALQDQLNTQQGAVQ